MRNNGGVAGFFCHFDGFEGFGKGTDLVDLDKDAVGNIVVDAAAETAGVGNKEVVADELHTFADALGHLLPAFPVVFVETIFDGDDWVFVEHGFIEINHFAGGAIYAFTGEVIDAILVKLGGSNIDREVNVFTRNKAGSLDGFDDHLEGFFVGAEVWCKAAFVTDSGVVAFALEHSLQRMEHFGSHA